ncbi:MAG: hypothetical protein M8364_20040 [Methylobacter sp.]|uniref:hypothetical protein n=1 Tax=Methylobacter sp. TaxID=2051955 RepID=UPI00258975CF|nr:hypothetical protein [Methylobacter sp.]MCL7423182.1 hypothetical protein [Methylobacter sp.]
MNNIIRVFLPIILLLGLLAACTQPRLHPMDMSAAVQDAKTSADHEALAVHYEQAAQDAETKIEEHKKLLERYKAKSYLYGRQASTLQAHCEALIRSYRQVVEANQEMANTHRQLSKEVQ